MEYKPEPFDFLLKLDNRAIQCVLREVDTRELSCALVDTLPAIKALIYANMSPPAAKMMEEDIGYIGKLDKKTIAISQWRIIQIARRLIAEGCINADAAGRYAADPAAPAPSSDRVLAELLSGLTIDRDGEESIRDEFAKRPLLFKIIILSSLLVVLMAVIVLVSWRVTRLELERDRNRPPAAETSGQNPTPDK